MAPNKLRKCRKCKPARDTSSQAASESEAGVALVSGPAVLLPQHIVLEVFSYLKPREIVRARSVARAFIRDAPALVNSLACSARLRFPPAHEMNLFPHMAEVTLDGDNSLVQEAAPALARCNSLRRLTIVRGLPQQLPLAVGVTKIICGLQLSDLDIRRVRIVVPAGLAVTAWRTLNTLVLRDAGVGDLDLANLVGSLPGTMLPLRHLDLSRNPLGEMDGMQPLARAISAFPDLQILELTANRLSDSGAKLLLGALLDGACPRLAQLELSLNFLGNDSIDFLAYGLNREGHGLRALQKIGIGGRFRAIQCVTNFEALGRSLAAAGLPRLRYLHVQGDVGPAEVGPVLRQLRSGACPELGTVKVERSTRFHPEENPAAIEDAVESMLELVTCDRAPLLEEVHVLGMNLGKGLERGRAPEDATTFYRATDKSSFHRLAAAGANRGVMVFV